MKVLVHHGKHGLGIWLARDAEEEGRAFLALFKSLDEHSGYYKYLSDLDEVLASSARRGDVSAAKKLLGKRQTYEYERWSLETVEAP